MNTDGDRSAAHKERDLSRAPVDFGLMGEPLSIKSVAFATRVPSVVTSTGEASLLCGNPIPRNVDRPCPRSDTACACGDSPLVRAWSHPFQVTTLLLSRGKSREDSGPASGIG
jgi:hypothetical protein